MQPKFLCQPARSARINAWAWQPQAAADSACPAVIDFATNDAVDRAFRRCTANKTLVLMGDSNTRNAFVGFLCRFSNFFPPYATPTSSSSATPSSFGGGCRNVNTAWTDRQANAHCPFFRHSHYQTLGPDPFSLHFAALYWRPKYDFPLPIILRPPDDPSLPLPPPPPLPDVMHLPLDKLLPATTVVDLLVLNVGIHLRIMCKDDLDCIRRTYAQDVTRFVTRLAQSGRVRKIVWRMSFPQRAPSSPRAPVAPRPAAAGGGGPAIASEAPLPSRPSAALGDPPELLQYWREQTGHVSGDDDGDAVAVAAGHYKAELEAMRSPAMVALGVEVLDAAEMLAFRSDAHTEEGRDSYTEGHTCLPGPLDDVNSLVLNRLCRLPQRA